MELILTAEERDFIAALRYPPLRGKVLYILLSEEEP